MTFFPTKFHSKPASGRYETDFTGSTQAEMDEHVRRAYEIAGEDQEISVYYPGDGEYAELKRREIEQKHGSYNPQAGKTKAG